MDDKTTIADMKEEVAVFVEERNWRQFHTPKDLSIGIITEASELLEHFRFKSTQEMESMLKDRVKKEAISEEIADVLYFILNFSRTYNIDLSEAFRRKMEKNKAKYPIEKFSGNNKKYNEV